MPVCTRKSEAAVSVPGDKLNRRKKINENQGRHVVKLREIRESWTIRIPSWENTRKCLLWSSWVRRWPRRGSLLSSAVENQVRTRTGSTRVTGKTVLLIMVAFQTESLTLLFRNQVWPKGGLKLLIFLLPLLGCPDCKCEQLCLTYVAPGIELTPLSCHFPGWPGLSVRFCLNSKWTFCLQATLIPNTFIYKWKAENSFTSKIKWITPNPNGSGDPSLFGRKKRSVTARMFFSTQQMGWRTREWL